MSPLKPILCLVLAGILCTLPLRAQSAPPSVSAGADTLLIVSPLDLIDAVMATNQSYRSQTLRSQAAETRTNYAGVYPDPAIMVTAQPFPVYTARGKQIMGLRLEQTIPYPGKLGLMSTIAGLEAEIGMEWARNHATDLILDAQMVFNQVQTAQEHIKLIESFAPRLNQYEHAAISKYEGGEGGQQAVLKIQLERARLDQALLEQHRVIVSGERRIGTMIHRPVQFGNLLGSSVGVHPAPPDIDLEKRSDIQALKSSIELASAKVKMAGYFRKPDLGVSLNWIGIRQTPMPPTADGRDALAVGLAVRLPIGTRGYRAREQEAELMVLAAEAELDASRQEITAWHEAVKAEMSADRALLELLESSLLVTAHAASESAISAYSNGSGSFLDLLDAERTAFQLQTDRVRVTSRLRANQFILDRISGQLNLLMANHD